MQNLCSAISEMHSASHLFMHVGSHQKLLDILRGNSVFASALRLRKNNRRMPKFPEKKKSAYLKVGLQLSPLALRPLLHDSPQFVCKNRVNASENLHLPQVSSILNICSSNAFSLPRMFYFKCPVDECNVFSILFILFVNLAL